MPRNAVLDSSYTLLLVEFMTVKCRLYYLPREFSTMLIVKVYMPLCANAKGALSELCQ